jgi:hypothetical protein
MAVDIAENKATLSVSSFNDGYTEGKKFNFALPVSGDYEVDFSETVLSNDEYIKLYTSGMVAKYSQGVLHLNIECTEDQGFCLEVKDHEHTYKARRYDWNPEQVKEEQLQVEGIEVHFIEGQEK